MDISANFTKTDELSDIKAHFVTFSKTDFESNNFANYKSDFPSNSISNFSTGFMEHFD
jgi:hypothetical protein